MIEILSLRHAFPEGAGFSIRRPRGHEAYTFLHFFDSIEIEIDGHFVKTEPHACILYRVGTPQFFRTDVGLTHDWMHLYGDVLPLWESVGLRPDTIYYPNTTSFITSLVREAEAEFYGDRPNKDALLGVKITELFVKLGRACLEKPLPNIDATMKDQLYELRRRILADLGTSWTVGQMAQDVHLSPSRFFALYKALFGLSPIRDLIRARIDAAKNMLSSTNTPLPAIAEALGYRNYTHFMRQFRAEAGQTPGAYRKENG